MFGFKTAFIKVQNEAHLNFINWDLFLNWTVKGDKVYMGKQFEIAIFNHCNTWKSKKT